MTNQIKRLEAEESVDDSYDTSDKDQVNTVRKKSARTRAVRLQFVAAAMTTEQGRAWLYDILLFCKIFANPYQDDPYKTAFSCGERNVGLRILEDIQDSAPEDYIKMVSENKTRKNG